MEEVRALEGFNSARTTEVVCQPDMSATEIFWHQDRLSCLSAWLQSTVSYEAIKVAEICLAVAHSTRKSISCKTNYN